MNELGTQYSDLRQQDEASSFGMCLFILTEILFFGGLFLVYAIYRITYPQEFAKAGAKLDVTIGTINTAVLLTSSYCMAIAVKSVEAGRNKKSAIFLLLTWILGFVFLALKAHEYAGDFQKHLLPSMTDDRAAKLFFCIYYSMTGLHAFHMIIGLVFVAIMSFKVYRSKYSPQSFGPVEVTGLYWHFVDLIWIFLYPLLYLIARHP